MDIAQSCATVIIQLPTESFIYEILKSISSFYKPIHTYLSIFICVIGAACNFCNIVVLTRRTMRTPVNMILTAMAFCDTVVLFSNLIFTTHYTFNAFDNCHPRDWSYGWAIFLVSHAHLSLVGHSSSVWLSVMLALIRYITLRSRGKLTATQINLKHSYLAIVAVILFVTTMNIPNFLTYKIIEQPLSTSCTIKEERFINASAYLPGISELAVSNSCMVFRMAFWMSGIIFKVIPCLILTLLVWLLTRILNEVQKNRVKLFKGSSKYSPPSSESLTKHDNNLFVSPNGPSKLSSISQNEYPLTEREKSALNSPQPQTKNNNKKPNNKSGKHSKTDRTTRMLLAIVCVFLMTEIPQGVMAVLTGIFSDEFRLNIYNSLGDFLDLMALCNACTTFIIYCTMSSQFRTEFQKVFMPEKLNNACKLPCFNGNRRQSSAYNNRYKNLFKKKAKSIEKSETNDTLANTNLLAPSIVIGNEEPMNSFNDGTIKTLTPRQYHYEGSTARYSLNSPSNLDGDENSKCSQSLLLENKTSNNDIKEEHFEK
uniref:G_PROTEIN_RECEP_F1_2 domain-containing protein n=1 Tax=Parastrongyloides trichosuri TaxID=131310 RepID=A0A0N4ZJZ9_PARTI